MSRVHIIGGGFSGLAVGYYLTKLGRPVDIFEKAPRVGGLVQTHTEDWGLVETAANGLLNSPRVEELFRDLDLKMAPRPKAAENRFIFREGRARRWPLSKTETLRFAVGLPTLLAAKNRGARTGETVEQWVSRVLGQAAFRYLVAPALQGIFGSRDLDALLVIQNFSRLSSKSAFAKLIDGFFDDDDDEAVDPAAAAVAEPLRSLPRIGRQKIKGVVAPAGGMGELIDALQRQIVAGGGAIHLSTDGDVRLTHPTVIATSAAAASLLLLSDAPLMARELIQVEYLPMTTATIATHSRSDDLRGFGCLFPESEGFHSLGVLFNNFIFDGRSPLKSETWMLPAANLSESEVLGQIRADRKRMTGRDDEILNFKITSWAHAIPHYNQALRMALENIDSGRVKMPAPLFLAGNYLGRLGLSKILDQSAELALKIHGEAL